MTREVFIFSLSLFPSDNHHLVLSTLPSKPCPSLLPLIAFLIWIIVSARKLGFPPPVPLLCSLSSKLPQDYFLNADLIMLLSC